MTTTEHNTTTGRGRGPRPGYEPTDEHKAAMAVGRKQAKIVGDYLDALEAFTPRRGRPVDTDAIEGKIANIKATIDDKSPIARLHAQQQLIDLEAQLEKLTATDETDLAKLEEEFIAIAEAYAERKGISYQAFRREGVPASTLKRAGITRS